MTNDDGVGAEGIDVLVEALRAVDGVEVTVVASPSSRAAPAAASPTGLSIPTRPRRRAGTRPAVDSFPADTIRVAFDELALTPDLVVSGINEGQNLGPVVDLSGTIGVAAAARRGVPASRSARASARISTTTWPPAWSWTGSPSTDALRAGDVPTDVVNNLNVPTCDTGELRGQVEVASATGGNPLPTSDCTSTAEGATDDVTAFTNGYATLTEVPLEPAAAPVRRRRTRARGNLCRWLMSRRASSTG